MKRLEVVFACLPLFGWPSLRCLLDLHSFDYELAFMRLESDSTELSMGCRISGHVTN